MLQLFIHVANDKWLGLMLLALEMTVWLLLLHVLSSFLFLLFNSFIANHWKHWSSLLFMKRGKRK